MDKYENNHFGHCPRVYCQPTAVVPCGRNDHPGLETVKLFCPNCLDLYTPPSSRYHNIDGMIIIFKHFSVFLILILKFHFL